MSDFPKPPTHRLRVRERNGKNRGTIGSGWMNKDGSINFHLHPCVTINWHDDVFLVLYPVGDDHDKEPEPT